MWQEVGEVAADLLLPNQGPDVDRIFDKKNPDQLRVPLTDQDAFKRRLTQSGWFDEEIVAAGMLNQGKAQSLRLADHGLGSRRDGSWAALQGAVARLLPRRDRRPGGGA